jgi:ubiquinone/menaquinone biosynthesis C-methylase UbiE
MFLSRRAMQEEYFDSARPEPEVREFFQCLSRLNRLFAFSEPFQRLLPQGLGHPNLSSLSILDLGAGDGSLGTALTDWATRRNWRWRVTNLDTSLAALSLNPHGVNVAASAAALPFREQSFDLVVASQMIHHLPEPVVKQLLRESWRVARRGILLCDLHRNAALYVTLWLLFCFRRFPESFRDDALLSVKRSWRVAELQRLALESGLENFEVRLYFGARLVLQAWKTKAEANPKAETEGRRKSEFRNPKRAAYDRASKPGPFGFRASDFPQPPAIPHAFHTWPGPV